MKKPLLVNVALITAVVLVLAWAAFFVRVRPAMDRIAVLAATGMTCGGCKGAVEKALQTKAGVASVDVDVEKGRVAVGFDSRKTSPEALAAAVAGAGYQSRVANVMTPQQYQAQGGKLEEAVGGGGCACCNSKRN